MKLALESAKILMKGTSSMLFPDYNWKQHSTGYLLKLLRSTYGYDSCDYDGDVYAAEYCAIKAELAKRPHLSNKRERQKARQ